jgi:hypothetical protein
MIKKLSILLIKKSALFSVSNSITRNKYIIKTSNSLGCSYVIAKNWNVNEGLWDIKMDCLKNATTNKLLAKCYKFCNYITVSAGGLHN